MPVAPVAPAAPATTSVGGWLGTLPGAPEDPAVHLVEDGRVATVSRGELAALVTRAAARLAGERRLVQVQGANGLGTLVGYLAAMTFTLVYGGEHYVFDVLVGWLYAALAVGAVGWLLPRVDRRRAARSADRAPTPV